MRTYFVTGATGAVGSAIIPRLLAKPDARAYLLLRADSETHLASRLDELFKFWETPADAEARGRVTALRGDASEPGFGLETGTYAQLVENTTHIIHCAATVRMNETIEYARKSAVASMQEILSLARRLKDAGTLQKVDLVSTVGIAGKRQGVLPETWINEPREYHNTYEQSKAEAEVLIQRAVEDEGLPITVHRPSMVIGDTRTGKIIHYQIFYFICEFLSGRKTLGLYPDFGDVRLDVIPVDFVADAIVTASETPSTAGRIFHLCTGPNYAPSITSVKNAVRLEFNNHGLRIPPNLVLPRTLFALLPRLAAVLATRDKARALLTLPIYLDYLADQQGFGNDEYRSWLSEREITLPNASEFVPLAIRRYLADRHRAR